MTELVLGTAQLGDGYGITNATGRLDDARVAELLLTAAAEGITLVDTADAYGDAEDRLGAHMPAPARYITKFGLGAGGGADVSAFVTRSLRRLRADRLHGVLLHRVDDVDDARFPDVLETMRAERESGRVGRVGVSIYDAADLDRSLAAFPDLDLLQLPGSVVDARLLDDPRVAQAAARGVEVHVRSVFLQGLLLQPVERLPARFAELAPVLQTLDAVAAGHGTERLAVVLSAVHRPHVAGVIVGATSAAELRATAAAWRARVDTAWEPVRLPVEVIDPRRW